MDLYKLMCVQGVQSREVLQLVLQRTPIFKQLILQISTNTLNLPLSFLRNHKEVKSARDPIVGPPDRPGNRVHCPNYQS